MFSQEHKLKISKSAKERYKNIKNHPNYKHGYSKQEYFCSRCRKIITWQAATKGSGMCGSCCHKERLKNPKNHPMFGKNPLLLHKINCKCLGCKSVRGENNNNNHPNFGKKLKTFHKENCQCIPCKSSRGEMKGKNSTKYIDGRKLLPLCIRSLQEYFNWRTLIFQRDNYTCQNCYIHSGNGKAVYLEAHHKKKFHKIFEEFLNYYNQFSPIEDKETLVRLAMKYEPFWNIDNGETLCEDCHNLTKGKKN